MKYDKMDFDPIFHSHAAYFYFTDDELHKWRLALFLATDGILGAKPLMWDFERVDKRTSYITSPASQTLIELLRLVPQEDLSILIKGLLIENTDHKYLRRLINDIMEAQSLNENS